MRILLVNSLYAPDEFGGAEKSVRLLAAGLRRKGVHVAVAATSTVDREDVVDGNPVYYARTANSYWVGAARIQPLIRKARWHLRDAYNPGVDSSLRSILRREKPDIVHTHNLTGWSTYAWTVARTEERRVVHTIRDHYLLCTKSTMFRGGSNCARPCTLCAWHGRRKRRGFLRLDAVTGVSEYILSRHRAYASLPEADAYAHIPNGVDGVVSRPSTATASSTLTFGFVGSLSRHKGVELLLNVFSRSSIPNARLCLFGQAPTSEEHDRLRNRFPTQLIEFRGWQDMESVYAEIDVLVVPSLCHEAFGRVVPEAYAHGIPVIAARRGGLPEVVKEGRTGFLFDPNDEADLEYRLRTVAADRSIVKSMNHACRLEAEQFASDRVTDQYVSLYQDVLR